MHFEFYTSSIWCLINQLLSDQLCVCVCLCVCVWEREREKRDAGTRPHPQTLTLGWGMEGAWTGGKKGIGRVIWEEAAGEGARLHPGRCSWRHTGHAWKAWGMAWGRQGSSRGWPAHWQRYGAHQTASMPTGFGKMGLFWASQQPVKAWEAIGRKRGGREGRRSKPGYWPFNMVSENLKKEKFKLK